MEQEHRVGLFQELSWKELVTECDSVLYLVRPSSILMRQIAKQVTFMVTKRVRRRRACVLFVCRVFVWLSVFSPVFFFLFVPFLT